MSDVAACDEVRLPDVPNRQADERRSGPGYHQELIPGQHSTPVALIPKSFELSKLTVVDEADHA